MSSVFNCPSCKQVISAEVPAGTVVQCPLCHQTVAVPGEMAGGMMPETIGYASARYSDRPLSQGTAIGALVCGILGWVVCPVVGIIGLILGIVGLNKIKSQPNLYGGRGMAIAGIWVGGASILLPLMLIPILLPSLSRARELSKRTVCSANLRGIGQAMYIYAQDDPMVFPALGGPCKSESDNMHLCFLADRSTPPAEGGIPSPTADMWALVRAGYTTPKQFICPSTTDSPDPALMVDAYYDFASLTNVSYGYQYQHDPSRPPIGTSDFPAFVLAGDTNPYVKGGVAGGSFAADRQSATRGNSLNHTKRQGQNLLFQDAHVAFQNSPDVALSLRVSLSPGAVIPTDNCYTVYSRSSGASMDPGSEAPMLSGGVGTCRLGGKSDTCLVP